jgi:hypothetical protein
MRARKFLLVLGTVFLLIAGYVWYAPAASPRHAALYCSLIGTTLLALGIFASDRTVKKIEQLLTGW